MYTIILALPIPTTIESYSVWQCAKQRDTRRNYSLPIICNGSWVYDLRVLAEEYEKVGLRPTNAMVARFEGIERDGVSKRQRIMLALALSPKRRAIDLQQQQSPFTYM